MKKSLLLFSSLFTFCLASCGGSFAFEIHTKNQLSYMNGSYLDIDKYTSGISVEGNPKPFTIKTKQVDHETKLVVSENEDFSSSYELTIKKNRSTYDLYNVKVGTSYYYKVVDDGNTLKTGDFNVKNTYPRTLFIDGVKNVRDLGFEGHIKQGLLYRGGEMNYLHGGRMRNNIYEEGLEAMNHQLKIKTEIDLRDNNETIDTSSPIGEHVTYVHAPMYYKGEENILTYSSDEINNPQSIKLVFETMADVNNYPIYFHCAKGKDRTGLISYLIKGLMGQSEEDIYKDYLYTNFFIQGGVEIDNILSTYVIDINNTTGDTLSKKIENYLVNNLSLTVNDINSIKNILKWS
jgi:protein-tyrosine phosphatase